MDHSQDADWIHKARDGLGVSCEDGNESSQTEFWAKLYNTDYYLTQRPKCMFRYTSLNIQLTVILRLSSLVR